jgi:hypothetical protein
MKSGTESIISQRFRRINKSLKKLKKTSSPASIHLFRLDVKHLDSFLKLLAMEKNIPGSILIPDRVKKAFRKTGELRLIQLEKEYIRTAASKFDMHKPVHYFKMLKGEEKRLKKSTRDYFEKIKPLKTAKFIHHLPGEIRQSTIQTFYEAQTAALHKLLTREKWNEKSMHEVRKILKNLLYNRAGIKNISIKRIFSGEQLELIKELESKIGSYHDLCSALRLLQNKHIRKCDRLENIIIQNIRKEWRMERRRLMKEIELSIPGITVLSSSCKLEMVPRRQDQDE